MATKKTQATKVTKKSEEKAPEAVLVSFEDFLSNNKIHPGLIASYKYEASKDSDGLKPRTVAEWNTSFEEQSNKTY